VFSEIVDDSGRIVVREVRIPPPAAAHEVVVAVGPAAAAGEGETDRAVVMKAACAVNKVWRAGKAVNEEFLGQYNPARQNVIADESGRDHH
jgi:hypothetical protein